MRLSLTFLLIVFLQSAAFAASFSCEQASTLQENLICKDRILSFLDEHMADAYVEAIAIAANPVTLKLNQREWLKKRDLCPDRDCFEKAYRDRILFLKGDVLPSHGQIDMACSAAFSGDIDPLLRYGSVNVDINHDGQDETVTIRNEGTLHVATRYIQAPDGQEIEVENIGFKWSDYGHGMTVFERAGNLYTIYYDDTDATKPFRVTYMAPDNTETAICVQKPPAATKTAPGQTESVENEKLQPKDVCINNATGFDICAVAREVVAATAPTLPMALNRNMTWEKIYAYDNTIEEHIRLMYNRPYFKGFLSQTGADEKDVKQAVKESFQHICSNSQAAAFINLGGKYHLTYTYFDGEPFTTAEIDECPKEQTRARPLTNAEAADACVPNASGYNVCTMAKRYAESFSSELPARAEGGQTIVYAVADGKTIEMGSKLDYDRATQEDFILRQGGDIDYFRRREREELGKLICQNPQFAEFLNNGGELRTVFTYSDGETYNPIETRACP
jgi:uncharacterized protein YecT (DUF1311 family)